ncbi:MAG: calcium-binding protein [Sporichthyaceae bacterium]
MRKFVVAVPLAIALGVGAPAVAASKPTAANGARCTIVGTSKAETLTGTSRADVICGLGGNDTIRGGGGDDVIDGGTGNDRINGESGSDRIYGSSGTDAIWGSSGNDRIDGGTGNDHLDGGTGNDRINGGTGNDKLLASTGHDTVWGGTGEDYIRGGTGNDTLEGGDNEDNIAGEDGEDVIRGGDAYDYLRGGDGNDRISGGGGNDSLNGDGDADSVNGEDGNDVVRGGGDDDRLWGSAGNDTLRGDSGNDSLSGGAGDDGINGDTGNDRLVGDSGDDSLHGGDGNDLVVGSLGRDFLNGDAGSDELDAQTGDTGTSSENLAETLNGGTGTNYCHPGPSEVISSCRIDSSPPVVGESTFSPGTVAVGAADGLTRLRVRVSDDLGATAVTLQPQDGVVAATGRLVSGAPRDGWWELQVEVARLVQPTELTLYVRATDRAGRSSWSDLNTTLTVTNNTPDATVPVVDDVVVTPATVDARGGDTTVTVTARIVDGGTGLGSAAVRLWAPDGRGGFEQKTLVGMQRTSGTAKDGRYSAVVTVERYEISGTWHAAVHVTDAALPGNGGWWIDQDLHDALLPRSSDFATWASVVPGGAFQALTAGPDTTAPVLHSVTIDRTTADSSTGEFVAYDLHITDVGRGVRTANVWFDDPHGAFAYEDVPLLISGTVHDGIWRLRLPISTHTSAQSVTVRQVNVFDFDQSSRYASPSTVEENADLPLPAGGYRTTDGAAWDGVVAIGHP